MRVLWLVNIPLPPVRACQGLSPLPGGGWLSATLASLTRQAPDLEIVCAARTWPMVEPFEEDGVRYITVPLTPPSGRIQGVLSDWGIGDETAQVVSQMRALLADTKPDLVHVHGTERLHALAMLSAAGTVPVLLSLQGSVGECADRFFEGMRASDIFLDVASLEFLKGGGLVQDYRRLRRAATWEQATLASARDVAGRTDWDRDWTRRANPNARYWRVGEVLRETFYETPWHGAGDSAPTVVAVTSAAPYKGVDVLLRAYARVRSRRECRLRIIGPLEGTSLWPSLLRLQGELGLRGAVEWTGPLEVDAVAAALSTCSVTVCASRVENSSNSVCEAMLVGAPVVASRTGGIPSLIDHGRSGLLFPPGDDLALADALCEVLDDDTLARRLGAEAALVASERHAPGPVAQRLLDVYATVASEGRP